MEKRFYPRVYTDFPAVIASESGVRLNVMAREVSCLGLTVECNINQRNLVTPGGRFVSDAGKPIELNVCFYLPDMEDGAEMINARCHVAFSRRITRDRCEIGVRYLDLETSDTKRLMRFIEISKATNSHQHSKVA